MSESLKEKKESSTQTAEPVITAPRFEQVSDVPPIPTPVIEAPVVMSNIETAASLYAIGYRADTHKEALKAFCKSTGFPSYGPMELMIASLRAYGYNIKPLR